MAKPRKLWMTKFRIPTTAGRKHQSKAEAYRFIQNDVRNYQAGIKFRSTVVDVLVDERDGRGWRRYETVDLAEWAEVTPRKSSDEILKTEVAPPTS